MKISLEIRLYQSVYILQLRVLCDVPCTTDRSSLHQNEGNIFNVNLKKLRIKLPEQQSAILQ